MRAVFTTKVSPGYDDLPEDRYHFPRTYLNQVRSAVGDLILYYEPRRSDARDSSRDGRQAYFATARVTDVVEDGARPDHFYAYVTDYLELPRPVPFAEGDHYYESALRKQDGSTNRGAFGRAVRPIRDDEFESILAAGFVHLLTPSDAEVASSLLREEPEVFERPIIERLARRPFREAAFAEAVKRAYDATCAMTGLRIINGGGRAEVQAAHIRPVEMSGTDSVRNGIALCGTAHWMFDRGLVSLQDDYRLLVSSKLPTEARRLLRQDLVLPREPALRPHPQFLRFHRQHVFKG